MKDRIHEIFPMSMADMVDEIKKAKAAQIGEVRTWSGVKMQKTAQGWVPVKEGGGQPKADEQQKESSGQPQDLGEHAKSASEAALQNAVKNSSDPEVRAAAHRELERRNKEEKTEMFDKPKEEGGEQPKGGEKPKSEDKPNPKEEESVKKETSPKPEPKKEEPTKEEKKTEAKEEKKIEPKEVDEMMAKYSEGEADVKEVTDFLEKWDKQKKEPGNREEPKQKYSSELDYGDIKNWIGDTEDKDIDAIYEAIKEAGYDSKYLKVPQGTGSQKAFNDKIESKMSDIMVNTRQEMWPEKMKPSEIKDVLWGMIMSQSTREIKKSTTEIRKSILTQSLVKDSGWIVKSHINEFTNNPELDVKVSGAELKVKFSEQLKHEAEEIRDYSIQIAELINDIGEMPQKEAKDCIGWKLDGWEDKIGFIPKMYGGGELIDSNESTVNHITDKMHKHDSVVRNLVDCMIEVVMLNTLINTIKDNKQYSLKVNQAAMLGF